MEKEINIDRDALLDAFISFYKVTGVKIVLFDINYKEILAYPDYSCEFCRLIYKEKLTERCDISNINSFKTCKETQSLCIYKCHAGLIEATSPLIDNEGITRGYLMFGQISTSENKNEIKEKLKEYLINNNISYNHEDEDKIFKIKRLKEDEIEACGKLLEMCTNYILLKGYINYEKESFLEQLNSYIDANIKNNLSIEILMDEFHMSRNSLYNASKQYLNIGIAEYIKNRKLELAKKLLKETNYSIKKVSDEVGFIDYNYFCRVFKKEVGISAKKYKYSK